MPHCKVTWLYVGGNATAETDLVWQKKKNKANTFLPRRENIFCDITVKVFAFISVLRHIAFVGLDEFGE